MPQHPVASLPDAHPPSLTGHLLFLLLGGDVSDQTGRGTYPFTRVADLIPTDFKEPELLHSRHQPPALLLNFWPFYWQCGRTSSVFKSVALEQVHATNVSETAIQLGNAMWPYAKASKIHSSVMIQWLYFYSIQAKYNSKQQALCRAIHNCSV